MRIAFDRFVALTAALAGASGSVSACGSQGASSEPAIGGSLSAGLPGDGGSADSGAGGTSPAGGSAGRSNGSSGGRAGNTGGTDNSAGSAGEAGDSGSDAAGEGGSGAFPPSTGGANASSGGTGGAGLAGEAGEGGAAGSTPKSSGTGGRRTTGGTAKGGTTGMGGAAGEGGAPMGGEAGGEGDPGGAGGEGGAPSEVCVGDTGIVGDCFDLGLPSDECIGGWNPAAISCYASTGDLRPGARETLANCLLGITHGACTAEAASATYACEEDVARRACPASEALDACANGIALQGGGTIASPLIACDDDTLTQESCTELLNAVSLDALPAVVTCADPAGEYGADFSGTCAERLHHCVFPHSWMYSW